MLQGETVPFGLQSSQEQERKYQLQRERGEEMRQFLAAQAANSHPRLAKLMKKNQMPITSITQSRPYVQLPPIRTGERRPSDSVSQADNYGVESKRNDNQRQNSIPDQPHSNQNHYAQSREPFYGYPYQPYQMPQQYAYQPNPYMPPIGQYSGLVGAGYNPNYSAMPFPTLNYPQPPQSQPSHDMYSRPFNYQNSHQPHQAPPPFSRRSTDRGRDLQQSDQKDDDQYGRRQDNQQSKGEYAAELERQIKEKEERKRKERNYRSQPESGFLSDPSNTQRQPTNNKGPREGMGNIGFESHNHNRSQQQTEYLRELDEQIRTKKEMQRNERSRNDHYIPPKPNAYPAEMLDSRRGSRKQFPTETAKIFNSMVFPAAQNPSPQLGRDYVPLPDIQSGRNSYDNLNSMFPPRNENSSPENLDLGVSNFVRGATHVSNMVGWQKDDFIAKQDQRRKNQLEIQDALKQQIAQKEFLKRKKIADERAEDEKERARLEKEQAMLKERYQQEKEEARAKEVTV
jgi:hypothetical protein